MFTQARTVNRLVAAAALLAASVVALVPMPSASAETVTALSGTPGFVAFPGVMLEGVDAQVGTESDPQYTLALKATGIYVGSTDPESDRLQNVQVRLAFQMQNGGWETYTEMVGDVQVQGSGLAGLGAFQRNRKWQFRDYRIKYTLTWTDAESGAQIAVATVVPSSGDTLCTATRVDCTSYGDRIGAR